MTDREIMQAVLEAMEHLHRTGDTQVFDMCYAPELIPALKHRLAQPEQEPVAWIYRDSWGTMKLSQVTPPPVGAFPVYTAPPQRKPLKLREIEKCIYDANNDPIVACRNVEAAHGIKENT